ncbi:MAG: hypothetical protein J1E36_08060 [Eubacterium sp.]|nr:hypothetical protein [Eubacterium sp.]
MKKSIILIAVLLVAVIGAFGFSYQYRNQKISEQIAQASTQAKTTVAEESSQAGDNTNGRVLITEDKENDYQIYYNTATEIVSIIHGEYVREFKSWAYSVKCEIPTIFCKDYDGDGENELVIKIVNGKQEKTDVKGKYLYTYALYMFKPRTTSAGEKTFSIINATENTWKAPFNNAIRCEMTQLESCKKILQFAMDDIEEEIEYDEKTGLTTNKYGGYAAAMADVKNNYYTMNQWSKGLGIYDLDPDTGEMTLDIQLIVGYKETSKTQYAGDIHCEVDIKNGRFYVVPKTIVFIPNPNYVVNDPRDTAKSNWSCLINNASTNTNIANNDIDWIETEFSLSNTSSESSQYFENLPSKIKGVDTVKFTQRDVVLTAKSGYKFSQNMLDAGVFSVLINHGEENEVNIAYTCSVKNENGVSTLTINFDKTYDKEDFDKVFIKFGV